MIRNVVDNATRYATKSCDSIRTTTVMRRCHRGDDGDGIDVSQSDRFFERFVRSTRRAPSLRCTGLGLAIVAEIVERHGGSARFAATDVGRGSNCVSAAPAKVVLRVDALGVKCAI